jgi:hypothetical protein
MQNWQQFFTDIQHYYLGGNPPDNLTPQDYWYKERFSAILHFSPAMDDHVTLLQRQIYIAEGPHAFRKAEAMKYALQISAQQYYIYKIHYDEYEKYKMLKKLHAAPTIKNKMAEDVHDFLLSETLASARNSLHQQIMLISPLLFHAKTPNDAALARLAVEKYLAKKVSWELKHPGKTYEEIYICPTTTYARIGHSHTKKHVNEVVVMPHFANTVGWKNLWKHPLHSLAYVLDGFRKIFFDYPCRGICWTVSKLTRGNKTLARTLNVIFLNPLLIMNILFFSGAKALTGGDKKYRDISTLFPKNPISLKAVKGNLKSKTTVSPYNRKKAAHAHRSHRSK